MSFLFVDQIKEVNTELRATGIKKVTGSDLFLLPDEASKRHYIAPALIGEAIGQLASWIVLKNSDFQWRAVGGVIQKIEMDTHAYVGDSVQLNAHLDTLDLDSHMVVFSGTAYVGDRCILTIKQALAPLLPLTDFNDREEVMARFDALQNDCAAGDADPTSGARYFAYDTVELALDTPSLVAKKNILPEPYLDDHFPNRPVFPLSMLLQGSLHLGEQLVGSLNLDRRATLRGFSKVKISDFIEPGDRIRTELSLRSQSDDQLTLICSTKKGEKVVARALADYTLE